MRGELQRLKRDSESGRHAAVRSSVAAAASSHVAATTPPSLVSAPAVAVASASGMQAAEAPSSQSETVAPPKKRWPLFAASVAALITALVGGGLYYRSHQAKPQTDKDTIVVADFDNKTGDAVFDETLKTALTLALNQSPFLNVLPDNKIAATLKMMTKPTGTKLTPEVVRELCQRAGSKAYILLARLAAWATSTSSA